jgi:hypothetical protein
MWGNDLFTCTSINHLLILVDILFLKYDSLFATHFHVGVRIYVDIFLNDLCVFEPTTTSKHIVQFRWSPQTYMFHYPWLLMMKEWQKITSHGRHGCYATTKKMREGYLFQKPWVCQAFPLINKLDNPKLHGSTMTSMTAT